MDEWISRRASSHGPTQPRRHANCYRGRGRCTWRATGDEFMEIAAGDLVVFPKGMSCTWDVAEAVDKHYNFE